MDICEIIRAYEHGLALPSIGSAAVEDHAVIEDGLVPSTEGILRRNNEACNDSLDRVPAQIQENPSRVSALQSGKGTQAVTTSSQNLTNGLVENIGN